MDGYLIVGAVIVLAGALILYGIRGHDDRDPQLGNNNPFPSTAMPREIIVPEAEADLDEAIERRRREARSTPIPPWVADAFSRDDGPPEDSPRRTPPA